ncbi:MAG: hypothetical protein R3E01_21250 [Pirellulaceae bacterium]
MAKRESQGLQIALILFVFITVLLAFSTYLFWSKAQANQAKLTDTQTQLTNESGAKNTALEHKQQLLTMLGFPIDAELDTVSNAYEQDMKLFGPSIPEQKRNYRELPTYMLSTIRTNNEQIAEQSAQELKLKQDLEAVRTQERARADKAVKDKEDAVADYAAFRERMTQDFDRMQKDKEELDQQLRKTIKENNDQIAKLRSDLQSAQSDLKTARALLKNKEEQITSLTVETFEEPDGRVVWVNDRAGRVHLDLGWADALQPGQTFSIYEVDETNLARAEKKGSIEVQKILGDHLSEARILDDKLTNPILSGDVVFSPVWQAGMPTRFALAGVLDVDGDGESDDDMLINLIQLNGGVVDASIDANGQVKGKITIDTRYLVKGDAPSERNREAMNSYTALINDATRLGVKEISLQRLLSDMGYRGRVRAIGLGKNARADDFPPDENRNDTSIGRSVGRFRERTPPRAITSEATFGGE